MAINGTNNNNPAILRRVGSGSNKDKMTFTYIPQGQMDTPDKSALITTDSTLSKIDVTLGGITSMAVVGGKRDFKYIKTIKDYNLTGAGATRVLDQYGRVLVIDGTDIKVEKTASGQPKFVTTSVNFDADNSAGNKGYEDNRGLTYYTKMTGSFSVKTLSVD